MNLRQERGQAAVFSVLCLTVLLGMVAMVLDIGSWYRADRAAQATADAAALAGAQALPEDPGRATALALDYADKNGGGLSGGAISFSGKLFANDTIAVKVERPAPGFFAKLFGIDSVTVGANASARAGNISSAQWVAPIAVDERHPLISGENCPCFGVETELDLQKVAAGAFRLMNIDGSRGGTGQQILADWILHGYDGNMELGWYYSDSGAKFNASEVKRAMEVRLNEELLFPVYRKVEGTGSNARYEVVGWIGFLVTDFKGNGNTGKVYGSFTRFIAQGIQSERGDQDDFGVRAVALVE